MECVPNFSEGRDEQVVREIVSAMQVPEVRLLDWSMDAAHNRSVVTVAGPCEAVAESAVRGVGRACQLIDLTRQSGEHPRIGAADVVPFVPVRGISMGDVVKLAHRAGMEMWRRYGMPVYFYEAAAVRPDRVKLEEVRRGQFEGLCAAVRTDSRRWPDVGAGALHPTAGAAAVGARQFLIAYNIYLDSTDVSVARAIAKQLRAAGGGMPGVKAMGVMVDGRAQVSMNLTDLRLTPVAAVHREVGLLAQRHGVRIAEGELIGLIPEAACEPNAAWVRQIPQFRWEQKVLEARLASPLAWPGLVRPVLAA
ncbi:glutamate formimidoyltransferase [Terriglobus aquaticus]|uniref:glutamate formimidoyltransferase n=1 Tax=Terriglobus aquaticus TaxID=940139 RepID=UPI00295BFD8B|nr:glutamate formimidoyltransferase [Terriglobus aquaticus]